MIKIPFLSEFWNKLKFHKIHRIYPRNRALSLAQKNSRRKERIAEPALRILNHCRTSVSLHCTDFIDYFTAGNIVNLFILYRRLTSLCRKMLPPGAHGANYASRTVLLSYSFWSVSHGLTCISYELTITFHVYHSSRLYGILRWS